MGDVFLNKKDMRKHMLFIRDFIKPQDILKRSYIIVNMIKSTEIFKNSKNIMLFASFGSEVFTHDFIKECITMGKNVSLPYIQGQDMKISQIYNFDELKKGYKDILEVEKTLIKPFDKYELDLIITPCVCYDLDKYRIGYGKGFYDRFFEGCEDIFKLGICFDECLVEHIEHDELDIPVDMIISDKRVII